MTELDDPASKVCHECIGDRFLADEVKGKGVHGYCSYCKETRGTVTLEALAHRIHEVLHEHFELTPTVPEDLYEVIQESQGRWERRGDPVADVIATMAGLSEETADEVTALLSTLHSDYDAIKGGEDDPYGPESMYEDRGADDWRFRDAWAAFRNEIRSRVRFFSPYAEDALNAIFGDLTTHKTLDGRAAIREISPEDEDRFVWRARTAQSEKELQAILESPTREIGPPPSRLAKGGRMNAPGIPVFYGALDESTCVAEARAPVGSQVVVAKFELLRPVRLLDLDALAKVYLEVYVKGSYFDPGYAVRQGRAAFLKRLVREISQPVMPRDEAFEYLPTQAVAEYLANRAKPTLDGIIFPSSQRGGVGHNLVLFNHACGVEPDDLPQGAEVSVHIDPADEDDEGDESGMITIVETVPSAPPEKGSSVRSRESRADFVLVPPVVEDEEHDEPVPYGEPTLRLDMESIAVLDINGVQYNRKRRAMIRYRGKDFHHGTDQEVVL